MFKAMLAYLILIGVNKNEQRVKAVAANYRRSVSGPPKRPAAQPTEEGSAEPMQVDTQLTQGTSSDMTH